MSVTIKDITTQNDHTRTVEVTAETVAEAVQAVLQLRGLGGAVVPGAVQKPRPPVSTPPGSP